MNNIEFSYNEEHKIIIGIVTGIYKVDRSPAAVMAFFQKIQAFNCYKLLLDCTETTIDASIFDISADVTEAAKADLYKKWIFAIVDPKHDSNIAFLETTGTNRLFNTKIFDTQEEAIVWLTSA